MTGWSSGIGLGDASGLINAFTGVLGVNQNRAIAVVRSSNHIKQAGDQTGLGNNFGSLADVTSALCMMGVTPDHVMKMGGSIGDFAGKAGGESVKNLPMGVLK